MTYSVCDGALPGAVTEAGIIAALLHTFLEEGGATFATARLAGRKSQGQKCEDNGDLHPEWLGQRVCFLELTDSFSIVPWVEGVFHRSRGESFIIIRIFRIRDCTADTSGVIIRNVCICISANSELCSF